MIHIYISITICMLIYIYMIYIYDIYIYDIELITYIPIHKYFDIIYIYIDSTSYTVYIIHICMLYIYHTI